MARPRTRDLGVGVVFSLAVVILAIAVMTVGTESALFSDRVFYYATFPTTAGLVIGSSVEMAGVQIGTVTRIRLPTDPAAPGIEVQLGIQTAYLARVRDDSRALLRVKMYLTGEKGVEITPGSVDAAPLAVGSTILLGQSTELLEQVSEASENLADITVSLRSVLGALERGEGLLGQMITDPEFGQEGIAHLRGTLANLDALTGDLRRGEGFVGRLLYDREFAGRLDDMGLSIERMSGLIESAAAGQGGVGALLADDGAGEQAVDDLREAAGSLRRFAARLEQGNGLLAKLIDDEEYGERVSADLARTLANVADITGKINSGEGTLGALVNERTLYDGMEDVAAGVNDSKFARWMLRHYQKKGIKLDDEAGKAGSDDAENDDVP